MYQVVKKQQANFIQFGYAYFEQQLAKAEAIIAKVVSGFSLSDFAGFFAFLYENESAVYLVADRARSIPLFYAVVDECIYYSEEYNWLNAQLVSREYSNLSESEFLLTGYVCGSNTLHPQIHQVEAGQRVVICKTTGKVTKQDCFVFHHHEPADFDEALLRQKLDLAVETVFKRLTTVANGRQIVLPLSGGFDSRLIASTIKRLGYDNVVCFSYGLAGNHEASLSKQIADGLGFPWHFIEYTKEKWKKAWFSKKSTEFQAMASQGSSLPHIQDWLAVKELKENNLIESDAIFVPGHSGDFVAGSHIPSKVFERKQFSGADLVTQILQDHYDKQPLEELSQQHYQSVKASLDAQLSPSPSMSDVEFANAYELWDWRERQSKYIINSVRVYEFFGLQWWLPLWDKEFVEFWCEVPLKLREQRLWYNAYVAQKFTDVVGKHSNIADKNAADFSLARKLAHTVYAYLPKSIKRIIYRRKLRSDFDNHFLAFGALLSEQQKAEYNKFGYTIIGIYCQLFLKSQWGKIS
ncbi:asparagine synthase-related protein [Pseudoalteromonas sp. T1lg65]|uniref:asparagine synthase-related protein n=1 Tax=Pseudoalteromonas sp. T1lg65 TaxID=2077101 RepID=UPI003F79B754